MTETDHSFFDNFSDHLQSTVGQQVEGLSQLKIENDKMNSNKNLSGETKTVANVLDAVDAGVQAFGLVTGAVDGVVESALVTALSGLGLKGMACLPVAIQLSPVLGIDIHFVNIPPSPAPVPMPHPYMGILLRPKDFLSAAILSLIPPPPEAPDVEDPDNPTEAEQQALNLNKAVNLAHTLLTMKLGNLGASVLIGGLPRVVAGTPTINIPHVPMGAGFHAVAAGIQKNKGHAYMGSLNVLADGDPLSGGGAHLHMNCCDVGIPSPHTAGQVAKHKEVPTGIPVYLPTGVINPIPMSKQVLTNPVPIPLNPISFFSGKIKSSFGRLFKKAKKKLSDKLHGIVNKHIQSDKLKDRLHTAICTVTGHPVDVADGTFFTDEEDFFLSGVIPFSWQRIYYSQSDYRGPLGYGWHHSYDMAIVVDEHSLTFRMSDGRPIAFVLPTADHPVLNIAEQMEARCTAEGEYYIWNRKEDLYYYFTKEEYKEQQLLSRIVDNNDFSIDFFYNRSGHLEKIIDSCKRTLRIENDSKGHITKIIAPHPEYQSKPEDNALTVAIYEYDTEGNLIKETNAAGDSMHFEYDNHLLTKEVWRTGLTWHFVYDGNKTGARCVHTWGDKDLYNHRLTFLEGKTIVTNSLGHDTTYYHKGGLVYKQVDAEGGEQHWRYDANNQLIAYTDQLGSTYFYDYDERGNTLRATDPEGGNTQTEYPHPILPLGHLPTKFKDLNGGVWRWKYDKRGNVITRINPEGAITTMEYQEGLLQTITDPLGNTTSLKYDKEHNITEVSDNRGNRSYFQYDKWGRCTAITNPKGAKQERTFDLLNRVIQVKDFDGNEIKLAYDPIDNLTYYRDNINEVSYSYKGMWKLGKRTDYRGTMKFDYNTEEQLTTIFNEKRERHYFELDKVGNVIEETNFAEKLRRYKRDLAGRVIEETLPSGKQRAYNYDKVGRVTKVEMVSGMRGSDEELSQFFEYYPSGKLARAVNINSELKFSYNNLGLLTKEYCNGEQITHSYNNLGQRISTESSKGANLQYEHDSFGQLSRMSVEQEGVQWESTHQYDSLGFELERHLPGKIRQTFKYDDIGRLIDQQTLTDYKIRHQRRYTWGVGNRLQQTNDSKFGTTHYNYDLVGHLQHATFGDRSQQWRKSDKTGNLFNTEDKQGIEYSKGNRLKKWHGWTFEYDDDGNLIEKYKGGRGWFSSKEERWQYKWDAFGMLKEVKRPDKQKVTFTYDALGRRLSKHFSRTTTHFLWSGNVPLHEWKETFEFNYSTGLYDLGTEHSPTTWIFEAGSFVPCGKITNGKHYSIITDHLGTPIEAYNQEGELIWEREQDLYGNSRQGFTKENFRCPFKYQGQYYDPEIELCYNRFRYYHPETGRYISEDPIGFLSGEPNFFAYVSDTNDEVDIFGLAPKNYTRKRKKYNIRDRGALSEHKGKQGVYIHFYKTPDGEKRVYIGQAQDLGKRPKQSHKEVESGKKGKDDDYQYTKVIVAKKKMSPEELNELEDTIIKENGGHKSDLNYNQRAAPGFG